MNFRGCFDVFPRRSAYWKWPKEDSRVICRGCQVLAKRPSKDLVGLPDLFFLGFCEDLLRISKRFRVCWPSSFPRTTKKVSTNFFTSTWSLCLCRFSGRFCVLILFSSKIREINTAENVTRRETKRDDGPSAKRRCHVEGDTFIIM